MEDLIKEAEEFLEQQKKQVAFLQKTVERLELTERSHPDKFSDPHVSEVYPMS